MEPTHPLAEEIAALEALLVVDRATAVERLRGRLETAARLTIGARDGESIVAAARRAVVEGLRRPDARTAESLLARATRFEVEIGSWASGPGEGVSSRMAACELALARAWLLLAEAPDDDARAAATTLAEGVSREPNGVGGRLGHQVDALRRHAASLGSSRPGPSTT